MKFCYYGHSCFAIQTPKESLLFDPFLTGNDKASISADEVQCNYLFLSHAHSDHFGDAADIAVRTEAKVFAVPEVIALFPGTVTNFVPMNLGGHYKAPFGDVQMVAAMHSCGAPGGIACGYIIHFNNGPTVYYSGDTALFGDMKLFGELNDIDYAVLPIGDNYTMGPADAVRAGQFLKAKHIIPVHYNTWPVIQQDPEEFKKMAAKVNIDVRIVRPGETLDLSR